MTHMRAESNLRRKKRSSSAVVVLYVTVLVLLGCLMTTVLAFALAWPRFDALWDYALAARAAEDSYTTDWVTLVPRALCALPLAVLVVSTGSAVVHTAAAVRVTAREEEQGLSTRRLWRRLRRRAGGVLVLYALRGALLLTTASAAAAADVGVGYALDAFTGLEPFGVSGPFKSPAGLAAMLLPAPLVLRLGFALAPAAVAVDGMTARAALRRSWALVWRRRVWPWSLAAGVLAAGVMVAVWLSSWQAVAPLRPTVRAAVLAHVTSNEYVAGAVAMTVPMATLVLLCAAVALYPVQRWLTSVYVRLR
ncbi:hypothetical protein ACIRF8_20870 [Streptomyces sp. NPDC102406]|uniref:hypothetical protein n=1 Tax=Streptomyces sp. NPDC102406 TaxID=3366171 RepID=UPI00382D79AD